MVGRSGRPRPKREASGEGEEVLDVRGLSLPGPGGERLLDDVSLAVRGGEVVALYASACALWKGMASTGAALYMAAPSATGCNPLRRK